MNRIAVVSGRFPQSVFPSNLNHKVYCSKNGYTYINCCWPTKAKNRYLNKIMFIKEYYNHFDYIFWIDDDAFFLDHSVKLEQFLPTDSNFLSICKSPSFKEIFTYFSSGQFVLKCNEIGRLFIDQVLVQDLAAIKEWWKPEFGFFTNGDQDSMVYLLKTNSQFKDLYDLWDYKYFNSRADNLLGIDKHEIFLIHFTGNPEKKMSDYLRIEKELGLLPGLLSEKDYRDFRIPLLREGLLVKVRRTVRKFFK